VTDPARQLPQSLRTRASFTLIRLAAVVRQECADKLATLGLSQHQHAILCCLAEFGPSAQRDVAARLGLDSGDLVAFLDGLQQAGLIGRDRDKQDRRRQILTLTASGRALLTKADKLLDDDTKGALGTLTTHDRAALQRLATRVLETHAPEHWSA
jgi:DNA-binding MarR family transcriptional regulator